MSCLLRQIALHYTPVDAALLQTVLDLGALPDTCAVQRITFVVLTKHCRFCVVFMNNPFHMLTLYIPLKVIGN